MHARHAVHLQFTMTVTINPYRIRLLLVDDHPVVRLGIRSFLSGTGRVDVVGEAGDGLEAVSQTLKLSPDVVFMDTFMPRMNGLVAAKLLSQESRDIKVLIHSVHAGREYIFQVLRSGARGYVPKNAPMDELLRAIECVHAGDTYFNSDEARAAFEEHSQNLRDNANQVNSALSCRELEVLSKIAGGGSTREIAAELGIGVRTVETHRERIMQKIQKHSIPGLTRLPIMSPLPTPQPTPKNHPPPP